MDNHRSGQEWLRNNTANGFRFYYFVTSAWLDPQFIAAVEVLKRSETACEAACEDEGGSRGPGHSSMKVPSLLEKMLFQELPGPDS